MQLLLRHGINADLFTHNVNRNIDRAVTTFLGVVYFDSTLLLFNAFKRPFVIGIMALESCF